MTDALQQALGILGVFAAEANGLGTGLFFGNSFRRQGPQGFQDLIACLADEANGRRNGHVGDDMRGIFQAQAIFDQAIMHA